MSAYKNVLITYYKLFQKLKLFYFLEVIILYFRNNLTGFKQ